MDKTKEGQTEFFAPKGKISKELEVFYNPEMKLNRDITLLFLKSIGKPMKIGLPLAGTGVRGLRIMNELSDGHEVYFNDMSSRAVELIRQNAKLNNLDCNVQNKRANSFLLDSSGFDYIDIDPFGSPHPFIESAVVRLARQGFLGVTATDTSSLSGSHSKSCIRKYWSRPLKNHCMHEIGMRILIRRVQLLGASHNKALYPLFSYAKRHYYRVFFRCIKSKTRVDTLMKKMLYANYRGSWKASEIPEDSYAGPLWSGGLWETEFCSCMLEYAKENLSFLSRICAESKISSIGFYHTPTLASDLGLKFPPNLRDLISKIRKNGFNACRTHFDGQGFRSDIPYDKLRRIIQ